MGSWMRQMVRWKVLYSISVAMLILIFYNIYANPSRAALLAFSLLALWSRVPCYYNDVVKDLEFLDFFTALVAINLGWQTGAVFGMGTFALSALVGRGEKPDYILGDTLCFFLGGFATPFVYEYLDHNLVYTMYCFTAIRYGFYFLVVLAIFPALAIYVANLLMMGIIVAYTSNTFLATYIGDVGGPLFVSGMGIDTNLLTILLLMFCYLVVGKVMEGHADAAEEKDVLELCPVAQPWVAFN